MTGAREESIDDTQSAVPDEAWSVARLNRQIETVLDAAADQFPRYVVGEIADVSDYNFATFFDLTDTDGEAQISCLAWADSVASFEHELEPGVTAVVRSTVDHYPERGNTQLIVRDYWPIGESQRVQQLDALRQTLAEEGAFDETTEQSLPQYPRRIGVVTSPEGSALEDFTATVRGRWPPARIVLCGASVQGDNAVGELVDAIQTLEQDPSVDVIVVTRGGGADATLWCFNEEPVVRTIADCTTPFVVAIGHEDDETLSEAVADKRAMTPTAAGVATTPNIETIRDEITAVERRIEDAYAVSVEERLSTVDRRITTALQALEQAAVTQEATRSQVDSLDHRIATAYKTLVTTQLIEIDRRIDDALQSLEQAAVAEQASAEVARGRVDDLEARIDQAYTQTVENRLQAAERRIETAYHECAADARVEAGRSEAKRLRIVVAVLLAVLLFGTAVVIVALL